MLLDCIEYRAKIISRTIVACSNDQLRDEDEDQFTKIAGTLAGRLLTMHLRPLERLLAGAALVTANDSLLVKYHKTSSLV